MSVVNDVLKDIGDVVSNLGPAIPLIAATAFGQPEFAGLDMTELGAGEAGMFSAGGGAAAGGGLSYDAFMGAGGFPGMAAGTGTATGGSGLWEAFKGLPWGPISTGINAGAGLFGLYQADQMQQLAKRTFNAQDPFGSQRGQYQQQLQKLMQDPNSVTGLPGYQFGLDQGRTAIERAGAAGGSGGNEAIALAQYTPQYAQQFYNNEIQRLMQLSGAGIGPSTGPALSGYNAGANIYSNALNTLGRAAAGVPGSR